jgi:hypothetical protein
MNPARIDFAVDLAYGMEVLVGLRLVHGCVHQIGGKGTATTRHIAKSTPRSSPG